MTYFYPLMLYLGFGGGLLLLGVGSIPKLRALRKPLSATCVTAMAMIWALAPSAGRWILSVWSPSGVTGGLLVLDMSSSAWWCVLLLLAAASGALWVTVAERTDALPLTGMLLVILLTVTWLALTSGSLLLTLAMWTVFDLLWFVVRLVAGSDGERVVWGSALNGMASLILWVASLLLLQQGDSGLWWLMRPSGSILTLMTGAALVRIGFYPFQMVHTETLRPSRPLALMSMMNPFMGVALLYHLASLPAPYGLPSWLPVWGCLSVFWSGVKALSLRGRAALLPAVVGWLLAIVTGSVLLSSAEMLLVGSGVWFVCVALLLVARSFSARDFYMSWPSAIAAIFLVGAPVSPLYGLYTAVLSGAPWGWRVLFAVGLCFLVASTFRGISWHVKVHVRPPTSRQWLPMLGGYLLVAVALTAVTNSFHAGVASALGFSLWVVAVGSGVALARWGGGVQRAWRQARPVIQLLDLQWLYRAAWQGAQHLLGVVRVTAEVVEGSGSVLWSVLILLLVLLVLGS